MSVKNCREVLRDSDIVIHRYLVGIVHPSGVLELECHDCGRRYLKRQDGTEEWFR